MSFINPNDVRTSDRYSTIKEQLEQRGLDPILGNKWMGWVPYVQRPLRNAATRRMYLPWDVWVGRTRFVTEEVQDFHNINQKKIWVIIDPFQVRWLPDPDVRNWKVVYLASLLNLKLGVFKENTPRPKMREWRLDL